MSESVPQFGRVPYSIIDAGMIADLKPAAAKIYLVMLAHADSQWRVQVGMRRLAKLAGVLVGSVSRSVEQLRAAGLITFKDVGSGRPFEYRIVTAAPADRSPTSERFDPPTVHPPVNAFECDRSPVGAPTVHPLAQKRSPVSERNRRTEGETEKSTQAALPGIEPPAGDGRGDSPVAFTFHTTTGTWTMTAAQRDKLRDDFPFIHVDTELENLAHWTEANPAKRKKAASMHGWLRQRLTAKQAERPLPTAAFYADGFQHASLPTDPTMADLDAILATAKDDDHAHG